MKKGLIIAIIISVVLSLPFFGYTWNLFMHIFGAIIFMGNIIVTAVWASMARRTRDGNAVRFATRGIVVTDIALTTPGVILLLLNGGILGTEWFKAGASWIFVSVGLFVVSAIIWLAGLVPMQGRMNRLAHSTGDGQPVPEETYGLIAKWFRLGGIASMLALITLVLMVLKPRLW